MNMFKNKVGRPSNEIKRKRITIICLSIITGVTVLCLTGFLIIKETDILKANIQKSVTIKPKGYKKIINRSSDMKFYMSGKSNGGFLQGVTYAPIDNEIYYTTSKMLVDHRKYTNEFFKLSTKNAISAFNALEKLSLSKVNDLTTRVNHKKTKNRNYYIGVNFAERNTYIYYNYNYKAHYRRIKNKLFFNIAYDQNGATFYSVDNDFSVYAYHITVYNNSKKDQGDINIYKKCKIHKTPAITRGISGQTIEIHNNKLYFTFVIPNGKNKSGQDTYLNYIGVYSLKNCINNNGIYPDYTLYLGTNNGKAAELEGIFFKNNVMYLGFNTISKYKTPNFYTLSNYGM